MFSSLLFLILCTTCFHAASSFQFRINSDRHASHTGTSTAGAESSSWFNRGTLGRNRLCETSVLKSTTLDEYLMISSDSLEESVGSKVKSVGMPKVLPPAEKGEDWLMWYHYRDATIPDDVLDLSTGRIAFARSKDGFNWINDEDSPVMGPNRENGDWFFYDSEHVGLGDIIRAGEASLDKFASQASLYIMYIFGGNGESVTLPARPDTNSPERKIKGSKIEIGVAVSQDGAHWSRIEGPSAFGSVIEVGKNKGEDFDAFFVGWPSVLKCDTAVGESYYMYYSTMDPVTKKNSIGLATSVDGLLKWTKLKGGLAIFSGSEEPGVFDSRGASRRHIIPVQQQADGKSTYRMYYEAVSEHGQHSIGLAVSNDGINWERSSNQPIFGANTDKSAWDGGGVGSPHLVYLPEKQRWRMYYVGYPAKSKDEEGTEGASSGANDNGLGANGIGMIESEDAEGMVFRRR